MLHIIGGSGFIGTRLCAHLDKKKKPFIIFDKNQSRDYPSQTRHGDIRHKKDLDKHIENNATIIHLAAEHRDDVTPKSLYHDVNVVGTENICTIARKKNVKTIIFTSTVAVYGFSKIGADENAPIKPFNDYGKTKYEAENVLKTWQSEKPEERILVIVRPTVVFGEKNRGNVYNLLRQIASGKFMMIGRGTNKKSMAYVENIAAFLDYTQDFSPGTHIYNYIDKPDIDMNTLVHTVKSTLSGKDEASIGLRMPYAFGYMIGKCFDCLAFASGKKFAISSIRVKKFCADTVFDTAIENTGFTAPVTLKDGLDRTLKYEFKNKKKNADDVYYTE